MTLSRYSFRLTAGVALTAVLLMVLAACAIRRPPGGGPEDKTPPQIVSSDPQPDTTNMRGLTRLEIRFDEAISPSSLRDQVWLLPGLPGGIEVELKGSDRIEVAFKDTLEADQTYILTVGTGVKDLRGNGLDRPFVLPFSTGPRIDRGRITGRVYDDNPAGIYIYAYQMRTVPADTPFLAIAPRYYTNVGEDGSFELSYLGLGEYRLIALRDEDNNRRYTLGSDRVGFPPRDIVLDSLRMEAGPLALALTQEDTLAPTVVRVRPVYRNRIELVLSEPVPTRQSLVVALRDSVRDEPLAVLGQEADPQDSSRWWFYTGPQREAAVYLGEVEPPRDPAGNRLADRIPLRWRAVSDSDTVRFSFDKAVPRQGAVMVRYDARPILSWTQPVDRERFPEAVVLRADSGAVLAGRWDFTRLRAPRFVPEGRLARDTSYVAEIDLSGVVDLFGRSAGDSVWVYRFSTWPYSELGEIAGTVRSDSGAAPAVLLQATAYGGGEVYRTRVAPNGPYEFAELPDGSYRLRAVLDSDGDGRWSPGSSTPFRFAEPFRVFPDTIAVRKRWATEGKNFRFD